MNDVVVRAEGLTKRFGQLVAVDNLSFSAQRGEILGIVGPDGSGKSTALRMLAGVLAPDIGEMEVAGADVVGNPEQVKSRISYMPQHFGLYEDLTVIQNIRFYADIFEVSSADRRRREQQLLDASGMSAFRGRLAGQLSGGMKRKLGIACALIHTPQVLLLDEPTTGVDPVSRRELWAILYSLAFEGVAVIVSTAYLDEAERCQRLLLMHRGRSLFFGTPVELKRTLPGGMLSIAGADPRAIQRLVISFEGVVSAMAMGDTVHLVVDDTARRTPEILAQLSASGLVFGEVKEIAPAVEDVFVYAVSEQGLETSSADA